MIETFIPIKNYENRYECSNLGNIKMLQYVKPMPNGGHFIYKEKLLKISINRHGYKCILLRGRNGRKNNLVHRLIAQSFINNPENKPAVNHINGDKKDNNVLNLEWCTYSENTTHAFKNRLMVGLAGKNNTRSKTIIQKTLYGSVIAEFESGRHVTKTLGFNQSIISKCCRTKHNVYKGYVWAYKNRALDLVEPSQYTL